MRKILHRAACLDNAYVGKATERCSQTAHFLLRVRSDRNFAVRAMLAVAVMITLILSVSSTGSADTVAPYDIYLEDIYDVLTPEQRETVEKSMRKASDAARCDVGIVIETQKHETYPLYHYAEQYLTSAFGENADAALLVYNTEEKKCALTFSGKSKSNYDKYTAELSAAFNSYLIAFDETKAICTFCDKLAEHGETVYSYEKFQNSSSELLTKGDKWKAALADYDDCLTDSEEEKILNRMASAAEKAECNIGLVITSDLNGYSDVRYVRAFADDCFGHGSDSITLMLLNTYGNPAYSYYEDQLDRMGAAFKFDKSAQKIFDRMYDALGKKPNENFYAAALAYCDAVEKYGSGI